MSFVFSYAGRLLKTRQKLMLWGIVSCCSLAFTYTYLAAYYMHHAMLRSLSDRTPHIRIFAPDNEQKAALFRFLSSSNSVIHFDSGLYVSKTVSIVSRKLPTEWGKEGELIYTGSKRIVLVGYRFDNASYIPPVLFDNVYTVATHSQKKSDIKYDPIVILNDLRENERCLDWGILSKNVTDIFAFGDNAKDCSKFEVFTNGYDGKEHKFFIYRAGSIINSPLSINSSDAPFTVYTKSDSVIKMSTPEERVDIIDIVIKNRNQANKFARRLSQQFNLTHIETWLDWNKEEIPFVNSIKSLSILGISVIVLLSFIGIGVLTYMLVIDKTKQLAIVYAMGLDLVKIRFIFLFAVLRVSVVAVVSGIIGGITIAYLSIPKWNNIINNFIPSSSHRLVFSSLELTVYILCLISFLFLVSWLPTKSIVKSSPIDNLRYE